MFVCSFFYLLFTCANPIRRRALISVSALFGARPPLHPVVLSLDAAASLHHKGRRRRVRECPKAEDTTRGIQGNGNGVEIRLDEGGADLLCVIIELGALA